MHVAGLPALGSENTAAPADQFYTRTLEHALGYFGSRVLYPARAAVRDRGELSRTICEDFMEAAVRGNRRQDRRERAAVGLHDGQRSVRQLSRGPGEPKACCAICFSRTRKSRGERGRFVGKSSAKHVRAASGQSRSGRRRPRSDAPPGEGRGRWRARAPNDNLSPGSPFRAQSIGEIRSTGRLVYAAGWRDASPPRPYGMAIRRALP